MPGGRLLLALVTLVCGLASAAAAPRLTATRPAPALAAWSVFCEQNALECAVNLAEPEIIRLDPEALELIDAVTGMSTARSHPGSHWGTIDRWDFYVDHFDLPVPLGLASRVQHLVWRYDLAFDGIGPDDVPFGPGEAEQFTRDYHATCDELERALGPAYSIDERHDPSPTPG